jgi:16S rRNA (guanine527-N7)-methyltransferase
MDPNDVIAPSAHARLDPFWRGAAAWGLSLTDAQRRQFARYADELLFWNMRMNLVSLKSGLDLPVRHFLDSLTPLPYLGDEISDLIDLGSGAGFPGLPIKIARPDLTVRLLEASRKKSSFLRQVVRGLGLAGIEVLNRRAEAGATGTGYDVVISRATWKLPEFVAWGRAFLKPGGRLVAMKGADIREERDAALPVAARMGLAAPAVHEFRLPVTGDRRTLVVFTKKVYFPPQVGYDPSNERP